MKKLTIILLGLSLLAISCKKEENYSDKIIKMPDVEVPFCMEDGNNPGTYISCFVPVYAHIVIDANYNVTGELDIRLGESY